MKLESKNGKLFLETEYTTGNKAWCAKITGTHPKWKFEREFINKTRKGLEITEVNEGDIIEEVIFSHSGKNRSTEFFLIENGEMKKISEKEVQYHFKG